MRFDSERKENTRKIYFPYFGPTHFNLEEAKCSLWF